MERQLILRAQKGDKHAFAQVFLKYEIELYKMAFVYTGNAEDALDIVQEVAYRSYKYINSLKEPKYFKTWLMRILMNCANDCLKKRGKHEQLEESFFIEEQLDDGTDLRITLANVMDHLTKEEKDVILLRFYFDYTIAQVADQLEMKLGTVKTILYRALAKLKLELEKEGDEG